MSKNDIVGNRQSLLARSSTPLFLLFCVLLSLAGGVVTFLVFAVGLTIFDAALSRRADISEPLVLIVATLIGLLFPIIVLKRNRKAARLHAANLPADAATDDMRQLSNTQPTATRSGDTVEARAPANKDADASRTFQVSQDLPTEMQPPSSPESDIARAATIASEAAPRNSDVAIKRRPPRPFFTVSRLLVSAGVFAAILLAIVFFNGGDLGLEVRSYGGNIVITNLKNEPSTAILDIVINNRDECSTEGTLSFCQSAPNAKSPYFLAACSRLAKYDQRQLHMLWVFGGADVFVNTFAAAPVSLKIGDHHSWPTACPRIVQVQITTDRGTATYSFSE
jgi:hypothetical protein